jgi:hypothetical protein
MAYLRVKRVKRGRYYYIMRSERKAGKVSSRVLEYLGASPDPKRLKRALAYWGVRVKTTDKRRAR